MGHTTGTATTTELAHDPANVHPGSGSRLLLMGLVGLCRSGRRAPSIGGILCCLL